MARILLTECGMRAGLPLCKWRPVTPSIHYAGGVMVPCKCLANLKLASALADLRTESRTRMDACQANGKGLSVARAPACVSQVRLLAPARSLARLVRFAFFKCEKSPPTPTRTPHSPQEKRGEVFILATAG